MKAVVPLLLALAALASSTRAAADSCAGLSHCRVDGALRSQVVRVTVTDSGGITAYHSIRTTLRLSNLGSTPLTLAYQDGSAQLSDDKGLVYKSDVRAMGIGHINRDSADPQLRLAPGETREVQWQQGLRYSTRSTVVGRVFDQSLTLAGLNVLGDRNIRTERQYQLEFPGLTATDGIGAQAGAMPPPAPEPPPPAGVPPAMAQQDACAGQPACEVQGPLAVQIVGVNVTDQTSVTRFRTAHFTVRVRNLAQEPLILGYQANSSAVSDEQGLSYGYERKVHGIGQVSSGSADTQFQLSPGETRDFQLEQALKYNVRATVPGSRFNLDFTLVRLAIVGPQQSRTVSNYALSFAGLSAQAGLAGAPVAADLGAAIKGLTNLFKGKKP